jgi:heme/copper-type cytochrome/quinol oxidase subunit 4
MIVAERRGDRFMAAVIVVLGVSQLAVGLWQAIHPESFFESVGGFGVRNDHYIRDVATWYLALGAGLLVASQRVSWRVPVLSLAVIQYVLHLVNHVADVGESDPSWAGPVDAVGLAVASVALAGVLFVARKEAR